MASEEDQHACFMTNPLTSTSEAASVSDTASVNYTPSAQSESSAHSHGSTSLQRKHLSELLVPCAKILTRRTLLITAAITFAHLFVLKLSAALPYAAAVLVLGYVGPLFLPSAHRSAVLEVLAEVNGWAWVEVAIVLIHVKDTTLAMAEAALAIIAVCVGYLLVAAKVRKYLHFPEELGEQISDFEADAVGYCLGALGHALLFSMGDCKYEETVNCEDDAQDTRTADYIGLALITLAAIIIRKFEQLDLAHNTFVSTVMRTTAVFSAFNLVRILNEATYWLLFEDEDDALDEDEDDALDDMHEEEEDGDDEEEDGLNAVMLLKLSAITGAFLVFLWLSMSLFWRSGEAKKLNYELMLRGCEDDPERTVQLHRRFRVSRLRRQIMLMAIAVAAGLACENFFEDFYETSTGETEKARFTLAAVGVVLVVFLEVALPKASVEDFGGKLKHHTASTQRPNSDSEDASSEADVRPWPFHEIAPREKGARSHSEPLLRQMT